MTPNSPVVSVTYLFSVLAVAVALFPDVQVHWGSTAVCETDVQGTDTIFDCSYQNPDLTSVPPPSTVPAGTTNYSLMRNDITSISQADFQGLISVIHLNLVFNKITALPADIFSEMPSLEELYVSHNEISTVDPNAFRGNPMLQDVYLGRNQIDSLHNKTFQQ